ncbi:MAG TPA: hypothetical protein PKA90_02905 [Ignavibacteria bacterium]|nr:hypothetical protein [Ignavibacteria bacterium]HMR39358.1 hypothetical protein [Ignavibacteria bacterium]
MKNFHKLLFLIFANLILISSVQSKTYYVNALTGSNSNTSVQAQNISTPWQSVSYAVSNAAIINGDNIVVAEGTYAGFELFKRVNIIGVWKDSDPGKNTIFNSTITLRASTGNAEKRMVLKNLRVAVTVNDAIDVRESFITLENVYASSSAAGFNGIRFNGSLLTDIVMESCNFDNSNKAGMYFPSTTGVDGLTIKNSTFNNNLYWGIAAFQTANNPRNINNVLISHCSFIDNNPANQFQGHSIYFEKLSNAVFENITVKTPPNMNWIGIDINLLARTDYVDISIENARIIRDSPGSGIWVQARNDLNFPAAELDTVVIRGSSFTNCDTNIAFNRQVRTMTVDKCDLSTYSVYGLVNYTDQDGTIQAANNKWQNGAVPDTTVISGGLLTSGNPVISFMPSTNGIFIGMGIQGPGIPAGTTVTGKTPNTIIMSNPATADGFIPQIGFAFNFATSTDIVRTSLNFVRTGNPLPNSIFNQANLSFPTLAAAILGTTNGGTIWNIPSGAITGVTIVDRDLTLISPGAGFLNAASLTTFDELVVTANLIMGSDFAVANNIAPGTNLTNIGDDNTLIINGGITPQDNFVGGPNSDISIGGNSFTAVLPLVNGGVRNFYLNRANGVTLESDLSIRRLLFLQSGLMNLGTSNVIMGTQSSVYSPNASASYVSTDGSGVMEKLFAISSPTAFNYNVGLGNYSPVLAFFSSWTTTATSSLKVRTVNTKHPQNQCVTDYLNRYWVMDATDIAPYNANVKFSYPASDAVGNEADIYGAQWDGFGWATFTPVNALTHTFTTNGLTSFGDFTGGGEDCIGNFMTLLNTKLLLQGAYDGNGTMRTDLNDEGIIPTSQPYANSQYDYDGTESVASIPQGVVDWIYIELRATADGAPIPSGRRAAFVKSNGAVVDLDGVSEVKLPIISGNYFIVIGHRNHIPVMSTLPQTLNSNSSLYDFTTGLNQYYLGDAANLGNGYFGLYAGDANESFIVSSADYNVVTGNLLMTDYNQGDINMSAIVSSADYNLITSNLLKVSNVPNFPPK